MGFDPLHDDARFDVVTQAVAIGKALTEADFPVAFGTNVTATYKAFSTAMRQAGLDPLAEDEDGPCLLYQVAPGYRPEHIFVHPRFLIAVELDTAPLDILGIIRLPAQTGLDAVANTYRDLGATLGWRLGRPVGA